MESGRGYSPPSGGRSTPDIPSLVFSSPHTTRNGSPTLTGMQNSKFEIWRLWIVTVRENDSSFMSATEGEGETRQSTKATARQVLIRSLFEPQRFTLIKLFSLSNRT